MASHQDSEANASRTMSRRAALGTMAIGGALLATGGLPLNSAQAAPEAQAAPATLLGRVGFFLSHEQFPAPQLVELGIQAEAAGFQNLWTSDHFQPWQDNQGHAGYARVTQAILGSRTKSVPIGTSITCPTFRYHPAIIAQSFATLSQFTPGRVILSVGTGEALNETAATGEWGNYAERAGRLVEAINIIRQLWTGQTVNFKGDYYQLQNARLYDVPSQPIPIFVAAAGPKSAKIVGQYGDGFISNDPFLQLKPDIQAALKAGADAAGKDASKIPLVSEVLAVVGDEAEALKYAELWRFGPLAWGPYVNNPNPVWIREQADAQIPLTDVIKNWTISPDPAKHAEAIKKLWNAGIYHVQIHSPQADQASVIKFYGEKVLPLLK